MIRPADPAEALARARQAMAAGDASSALRLAEAVVARDGAHLAARQLAAVAARRLGDADLARRHLEAALAAAPRDAHLLNSYANLLLGAGETSRAREVYEAALGELPDQPETLVNLALACKRLGDRPAAFAALREALALAPGHARALQTQGLMQLEDGEAATAARSLDLALAAAPQDPRLLAARAQAESELGGDAAPFYVRARAIAPADPELAHAHAVALAQAGGLEAAEGLLEQLVAADPGFAAAHATLARLRWQDGQAERSAASFEQALQRRPQDAGLWWGLFGLFLRTGRPQAVLDRLAAARPALGEAAARGLEAAAASEAGEIVRADAAFADLDPAADPGLRIAYLRHQLRAGRPEAAAAFALAETARGDADDAWPYLATAWRLLGDTRADWLEGDPAYIRAFDLPIAPEDLARLAEVLRGLHRSRAAPFDQTLRGGTQTEGGLLGRREPEIAELARRLRDAVADYVAGLPPPDPAHPLLRGPRDAFRFAGSWSVRLLDGGFHENHVHTTGWISSACYIALPESLGREAGDTRGWLTFGAPPAELGLDLPAFRRIAPAPGRLALFPSTVWHGTEPFAAGERLTVAFDVQRASG